jgi:hypothetical protein
MKVQKATIWRWLALAILTGASVISQATEEPAFELIATRDGVEYRHYGPAIQAVTPMTSSGSSFKRLAGFIFGGNDRGESIAMTAPVQENLTGELQRMAFFMPAAYSLESMPQPESADVEIREVPARIVAVLGFSGWATAGRVEKRQRALAEILENEGIEPRGEWLLNQYNPPWTPPFMRRNEIWVEVDRAPG